MLQPPLSNDVQTKIKTALAKLDQENINLDGISLIPSQCYHVELDPLHVLFNTNCPDKLKEKVQGILSEHYPGSTDNTSV